MAWAKRMRPARPSNSSAQSMFRNHGPRVIRPAELRPGHPGQPGERGAGSAPAREVASFCVRRNDCGSGLWMGEQTAW